MKYDAYIEVPTHGNKTAYNLLDRIAVQREQVVEEGEDVQTVIVGTRLWMKALFATAGAGDSRFIRSKIVPWGENKRLEDIEIAMVDELVEAIRNQA